MACFPGRVFPRLPSGGAHRHILPSLLAALLACAVDEAAAAPASDSADPAAAPVAAVSLAADAATLPGLAWADTLLIVATPILASPLPNAAAVVTRIDLGDEPAGRDLAELLDGTAGLQVRRLDADGSSAIPSLRGGSGGQVRLFLDGMPLPDAWDGAAGLGLVPVERLAAIEVHRGVVPASLGGVGGIGAINLLTSRVPAYPYIEAAVGAFGARSLRAGAGWVSADGLSGLDLVAHARRADNDFAYLDHRQTFHNTADDTLRTRANAWLREWGAWLGASRLRGRLALRAGAGYLRRDGGRPGPLTYLSPHASVRRERGDLSLRADWDDGRLTADLAAGRGDERLDDSRGEVQWARPGVSRSVSHDLDGRAVWSPRIRRAVAPSLGVTWRRLWQQDSFDDAREPQRRRTQHGVVAAVDVSAGRVHLTPAWRWQRTTDAFAAPPLYPWLPTPPPLVRRDDRAPSLGAVWEAATGRLFVEAHAARARREPSWVELFGVRGGIDGNPDLKPERITSYDAAVTWRPGPGRVDLRAAAFTADTADKIIFVQNSQLTSKAVNIGRARTRGLEGEASLHGDGHWRVTGNVTWQDARDRSGLAAWDGNPLPYLPPVEARLYVTLAVAGWEPWGEWTHQSGNARDRADTELARAPARTRFNLGLGRTWAAPWLGRQAKLNFSATVENVADASVYDVEGFPLPGRTWRLAVALRDL